MASHILGAWGAAPSPVHTCPAGTQDHTSGVGFVGTGAAASSTAWPEAGASIRTKVEPPRLSEAVDAGSPQGAGPRQPWLLCLVLPSLNRTLSAPPGRRRGPGPSPSQANPPPLPGTVAPGSDSRRGLLELQAPCALRLRHARPRTWALGGSLRVLRSQIRQNHNLISPGQRQLKKQRQV